MNKKTLVFMPGDEATVKLHFMCKKTIVLKIEAIEIDNSDSDDIFVNLDL